MDSTPTWWAVIGIVSHPAGVWPTEPIRQTYRGRSLLLRPEAERSLATVSVEIAGYDECDDAAFLLRRFLSAASWGQRVALREVSRTAGSACPPLGRGESDPPYRPPTHARVRPLWAPEPPDSGAQLALALYREGLNEQNWAFRYLSFFKVVETLVSGREAIIELTARHLAEARERRALRPKPGHELPSDDGELAERLFKAGRCAIAHAHRDPLVNPDDPTDTDEIARDVFVIQGLAEVVIEKEHQVPRWQPNGTRIDWSPV